LHLLIFTQWRRRSSSWCQLSSAKHKFSLVSPSSTFGTHRLGFLLERDHLADVGGGERSDVLALALVLLLDSQQLVNDTVRGHLDELFPCRFGLEEDVVRDEDVPVVVHCEVDAVVVVGQLLVQVGEVLDLVLGLPQGEDVPGVETYDVLGFGFGPVAEHGSDQVEVDVVASVEEGAQELQLKTGVKW
jgi:hypothetical protein